MSSPHTDALAVSRPDAVALYFFVISGVGIAAWTVFTAAQRIVEVAARVDVPVLVEFDGTSGTAPVGPGGADAAVQLEMATVVSSDLPGAVTWSLVMQQIVLVATVLTAVATLLWLTRNILRGVVFSRTNTRLVTVAGVTGVLGFCAVPFFGNMGANGVIARVSDRGFDNPVMSVDLFPLLLLGFVAGVATLVFTVGDRLQRETAGLV